MRTLHVDTGREMRGGQWQVVYLLEGMPDATLLARAESPLFAEAKKRGIAVRPLSYLELRAQLRRHDIVHAHDARAHTMASVAGGPPLVVSRRVAFPVKTGLFSKWKYRHAAMYLAVSKFVASRLMQAGVGESKIRVVFDGVPIPAPAEPVAGRVVMLRNKSADLPGIRVHWADNLWSDLHSASVFVYVSEMEGLGSGAIAAMACGVPVVACGSGGLSEVVENGVTGYFVERSEVAGAVATLLENSALAAQMGQRARERAIEHFSVDAMRLATMRAYKEVLS
ncbi:MAG: glycosyltransferase family 4 protein [Bryobacteraceae bacterium]